LVVSGGQTYLDEDLRRFASSFAPLDQYLKGMYAIIADGEMSATDAAAAAATANGEFVKELRENIHVLQPLIAAATLLPGSGLDGISNMADAFLSEVPKSEKSIKDIGDAIDAMANAPDKLTYSLIKNSEAMLAISVDIEQASTSILPSYSSALATINTYMKDFVEFLAKVGGNIGNILAGDFGFLGKYSTGSDIGVTMGQGTDSANNRGDFTSTGELTGASATNPDNAIPVADRVLLGDMRSLLAKADETNRILQQETLKTTQTSDDVTTESKVLLDKQDALIAKVGELLAEAKLQTASLNLSARANRDRADSERLVQVYNS